MTVRQNILFGAKGVPDDERNERYRELTETFYVHTLENKRPV